MGSVYACWLIYAAGLSYMLTAVIFIACGIPVYIWARREEQTTQKCFTCNERRIAVTLILVAIFAVYAMVRGIISV
jgi:arginine:ornithine antiporter/lysine permease